MTMPPSRMAVVGEPGMPSVSIGSIEPVLAALLAASGATTPSTLPLPKLFGIFGHLLGDAVGHQRTGRRAGSRQDADEIAEERAHQHRS